jgi:hypothetical protein
MNFMPKLVENKLVPSAMYLDPANNGTYYPVVLCKNGDKVLFAQPIYITQNRYSSAALNEWDGSLTIDEENGTILSTMVGAGRKTPQNTFEGVLMGDVGGSVKGDNATGIGLYGYHDGAQSFNFSVDGTAFLGKSGHGRIKFDGNKGTITSATYKPEGVEAGMLIDLDDGLIDIYGARRNGDLAEKERVHIVLDA